MPKYRLKDIDLGSTPRFEFSAYFVTENNQQVNVEFGGGPSRALDGTQPIRLIVTRAEVRTEHVINKANLFEAGQFFDATVDVDHASIETPGEFSL